MADRIRVTSFMAGALGCVVFIGSDLSPGLLAKMKEDYPDRWYMARFVAPGGASVSDMIEYGLDGIPIQPRDDNARETFLHGSVYKARPDVMAVVHSHTPEFVAFGMSSAAWSTSTCRGR